MRVVIAEDPTLLREACRACSATADARSSAAVDDGPSSCAAIEEHRPDIAVVDVRLPPTFTDEGIRAAIEARERVPGTPILILSQYVEESYAQDLLATRAAASATCSRTASPTCASSSTRSSAWRRAARPWTRRWSPSCWAAATTAGRCRS